VLPRYRNRINKNNSKITMLLTTRKLRWGRKAKYRPKGFMGEERELLNRDSEVEEKAALLSQEKDASVEK